ncbi:hypothetical protein DDE01_23080 [Desulfovibrio desulfuricans]|uniref:Uncharacterized protein n=1 Tax=Nitratidesulfovibrio vulgaris (strain DP4) TaxID=391774 RepID=A0A0H3AAZ7_NITV4|nr:hypothetical protein Dvul_2568 [Nitratidesulfovibrio vulgaris DP4]GEB80893.1 hypothetical protein DDE01_23080 [Desulfovibrio desulfuricans]
MQTVSASATHFIVPRPTGHGGTQDQFFSRNLQRFLKAFYLHGTLAQYPFQIAYTLLEPPNIPDADDQIIRMDSNLASVAHKLLPAKQNWLG